MTALGLALASRQTLVVRAVESPERSPVREQEAARLLAIVGPPGPQGPAGSAGQTYTVASPAGTWIITHGLGRVPSVQVFLTTGELVVADVTVDSTHVTIVFPTPTSGFAIVS